MLIFRQYGALGALLILFSSLAFAEIRDGHDYLTSLKRMVERRLAPTERARLAAELLEFDLNKFNQGLSREDRAELGGKFFRLLSKRDLTNRDRMLVVRGAGAIYPAGSKPGEVGSEIKQKIESKIRSTLQSELKGPYVDSLIDEGKATLKRMGAHVILSPRDYVAAVSELADLLPTKGTPQKPARREALLQALDAADKSIFNEKLKESERRQLGRKLTSVLSHSNADVHNFGMNALGELFSTDARGRVEVPSEAAKVLREYAANTTPGVKPKVRRENAAKALAAMGEPESAEALVKKLYALYTEKDPKKRADIVNELNEYDPRELANATSRDTRFQLAGDIAAILESEANADVYRFAGQLVEVLIPKDQMQHLSDTEHRIRDRVVDALDALERKKAGAQMSARSLGKLRPSLTAARLRVGGNTTQIEKYVRGLEQIREGIGGTASSHFRKLGELKPETTTGVLTHERRFALAKRALSILKDETSSPKLKQHAFSILPHLVGRDHVKRVDTGERSKAIGAIVQEAERALHEERVDSALMQSAKSALLSVGGIPIYDAKSYANALLEFSDLVEREGTQPATSVDTDRSKRWENYAAATRREKLSRALRGVDTDPFFKDLKPAQRQHWARKLESLLGASNAEVLQRALEGLGVVGGKTESGQRRSIVSDAALSKIQDIATREVHGDGDRAAQETSLQALRQLGVEAHEVLRTPGEFAEALKEFSLLEGQQTERARVLREALSEFDFAVLKRQMSPEARKLAVGQVLEAIESGRLKSKDWGLKAIGGLLETQGKRNAVADKALLAQVEKALWKESRKENSAPAFKRAHRRRAIESLRQMGKSVMDSPELLVKGLEQYAKLGKGKSAERNALKKALQYYNLDAAKLNQAERRALGTRLAAVLGAVLGAATSHPEAREHASKALGVFLSAETRQGAGLPRAAVETLRAWGQEDGRSKRRRLADDVMEQMGIPKEGKFPAGVVLEIFDPREERTIGELVQDMKSSDPHTRLEAVRDLGAHSAESLTGKVWRAGDHSEFPKLVGELLRDGDPSIKDAMMRQLWRWFQEAENKPAWLSKTPAIREGIRSNLGSQDPVTSLSALELISQHMDPDKQSVKAVEDLARIIEHPASSEASRLSAAKRILSSQCGPECKN